MAMACSGWEGILIESGNGKELCEGGNGIPLL